MPYCFYASIYNIETLVSSRKEFFHDPFFVLLGEIQHYIYHQGI